MGNMLKFSLQKNRLIYFKSWHKEFHRPQQQRQKQQLTTQVIIQSNPFE
jgi:hypothetical protein